MVSFNPNAPHCFAGHDAWSREARRLQALAANLHVRLDPEALFLSDVRDLQAYRFLLERRAASRAWIGRRG